MSNMNGNKPAHLVIARTIDYIDKNKDTPTDIGDPQELRPVYIDLIDAWHKGETDYERVRLVTLSDRHISKAYATLTSVETPEKPAEQKYKLLPLSHFRDRPRPEWGIENIIFTRGVSVFVGSGGVGKSTLRLDMSLCRAAGIPFLGRPVKQGFVIWVAAEGEEELWDRALAWMIHNKVPQERELDILFFPDTVPFNNTAEITDFVESVKQQMQAIGREVSEIVFDTYARCTPGADENDTAQTKVNIDACIRVAKELDCHVSTLHHVNAQGKMRGNTAFRDGVMTMWEVSKEEDKRIKLHCDKMRAAKEPDDFYLEMRSQILSDLDVNYTAPVIVAANEQARQEFIPNAIINMLDVLHMQGKLTYNTWKKQCEIIHKIPEGSFARYLKEITKEELVNVPELGANRSKSYSISEKGLERLEKRNGG